MTVDNHRKPDSSDAPERLIFEAFSTSEDFEERLANIAAPDLPGPRKTEKPLEFQPLFLEEREPEALQPTAALSAPPEPKSLRSPLNTVEVGIDPGQAQYQFHIRRLQERQEEYPEDTEDNAIKQSANVILYILEAFQYPVDEEKRGKIVRRMRHILGQPREQENAATEKDREAFHSERLREKVDVLYRRHMRRYAQHRMEKKKLEASNPPKKTELSEAEQRAKAEQKRQEKEKRLAQTSEAMSEEKLKQLEEEFDAMMLLSASNYGISTAKLMSFGYEEPEEDREAPVVSLPREPRLKPKAVKGALSRAPKSGSSVMPSGRQAKPAAETGCVPKPQLTPQEIIERNNERRRLRGLRDDKK